MKSIFLILLSASACLAESVTFTPSKDSDIYSYTDMPPSSFGTLGINSSGAGAPHSQRSLIQFELGSLTIPSAEIGKAVLRLYVLKPDSEFGSGISPGNVVIHRQGQSWTITSPTLRWNKTDPKELAGTLPITAAMADSWVEVDVTTLVKTWTSGAQPNYGFLLMPENELATPWLHVDFAAMELAVAGVAPQLVISRAEVAPVLTIASSGTTITLQWPVAGSTGWTLQRSTNLTSPWTNNTATVSTVGGNWQLQMPVATREFFRLIRN